MGQGYQVIYKLHQGELVGWKEKFPWLDSSGITVIDHDRCNLYALLAESRIQIGVCSTALYEGMAFGCATYCLDLPGVEIMEY